MPSTPEQRRNYILDDLKTFLPKDTYEQLLDAPLEWLSQMYPHIENYGAGYPYLRALVEQWEANDPRVSKYTQYVEELGDSEIKTVVGDELWKIATDALVEVADLQREKRPRYRSLANQRELTQVEQAYMLISADFIIKRCLLALQIRHLIPADNKILWSYYEANTIFVRKTWGPVHPDDATVEDLSHLWLK